MSSKRGQWIARRGQADVEAAIDRVIDRQPQPGELVQELLDDLIEDSPYQARLSLQAESVEELAQGMREAGFQGVLIARPHSDVAKCRRGMVQLVYGHRRRVAWRQVCAERGSPCVVPVVVRQLSDAQLLTVGAQENLQRDDLDPIEEAQIVAWHERMFFDKNQTEIGAMLGKSSDWVSVRSRIHKLPEALKVRLRQRPRAIAQMLELASFYAQQPELALALADRVVNENMTVMEMRGLIRDAVRSGSGTINNREEEHNRRANATIVQDITTPPLHGSPVAQEVLDAGRSNDTEPASNTSQPQHAAKSGHPPARESRTQSFQHDTSPSTDLTEGSATLLRLQEVAAALATIASRAETLPRTAVTDQAIAQAEQAIAALRRNLASHASRTDVPAVVSSADGT